MTISIINFDPVHTPNQVYYPHLLSTWTTNFRTVFASRTEKRALMTNLVKGGTSFADPPQIKEMKALSDQVIPAFVSIEEAEADAHEMLRRFYLHKARSWKIPEMTHLDSTLLYVPFEYFERPSALLKRDTFYLYEPLSGSEEPLKKHPEIYDFIRSKEAIL
ncbi:hypothetical protein [Alkalicoccus chagannorensis]|uniref:hypothetical protein n=1 Tax=Alkalicoccus chagannorensis TaxID=427072 RepID=UPI0003FBAF6C|nr:hypothetical protein [Alkalicoccus chagannorensis]